MPEQYQSNARAMPDQYKSNTRAIPEQCQSNTRTILEQYQNNEQCQIVTMIRWHSACSETGKIARLTQNNACPPLSGKTQSAKNCISRAVSLVIIWENSICRTTTMKTNDSMQTSGDKGWPVDLRQRQEETIMQGKGYAGQRKTAVTAYF